MCSLPLSDHSNVSWVQRATLPLTIAFRNKPLVATVVIIALTVQILELVALTTVLQWKWQSPSSFDQNLTQPYPTLGQAAFGLGCLLMFPDVIDRVKSVRVVARTRFLPCCFQTSLSIQIQFRFLVAVILFPLFLLPVMWFLWLHPTSGNANFIYFQTLIYQVRAMKTCSIAWNILSMLMFCLVHRLHSLVFWRASPRVHSARSAFWQSVPH